LAEDIDKYMSVIYYPISSKMYQRNTVSASYEQIALSMNPNTILYFSQDGTLNALSASTIEITASQALTASSVSGGAGGLNGMDYFTSTTTWTVPAGIKKVRVIAVGGGSSGINSQGGVAGAYVEGVVSVVGSSSVVVTVGTGSAYNAGTPTTYQLGGNSQFGWVVAAGGQVGAVSSGSIIQTSTSYGNADGVGARTPWTPVITSAAALNISKTGRGQAGAQAADGMDGCIVIYY
jgi:hypothetical protein